MAVTVSPAPAPKAKASKKRKPSSPAAATKAVNASGSNGFVFEKDIPVPTQARSSKLSLALQDLPVGQSFFILVGIAGNIKATEKAGAMKEACNRVKNKISSARRRINKSRPKDQLITRQEQVTEPDNGVGVRVWRVAA